MKKKRTLKELTSNLSKIIEKHKRKILIAYIVALVAFFSVQFILLQNWDMLVRIMNANFLFHHGYYLKTKEHHLKKY